MAVTVDATVPDPWRAEASVAVAAEGWMTGQRPSRSLVPKHRLPVACCLYARDITMRLSSTREPNATVDLDGHRSASNLEELDLGEQAGAVA